MLGLALLTYCTVRLFGSPAAGSVDWRTGAIAGALGGILASAGWIGRTLRHGLGEIMPWQWFTVVLLAIAVIVPHSTPGKHGPPLRPVASVEDAALTAYSIVALVSTAVVAFLWVAGIRTARPEPPAPESKVSLPRYKRKVRRRR
ncbi:hypothetical protein Acsp01_41220 [Actinoplanes sp. NBRC 101535]|nr:hypothetical protein Acsp01_41220 [Actinoplanes sp. NBRC 101535]